MIPTNLIELAERCEAATGPDRELDLDCWWWGKANGGSAKQPMPEDYRRSNLKMDDAPRYTASLDAAMTLVPEGWTWHVNEIGRAACFKPNDPKPWPRVGGLATTPALALCAAALRARATINKDAPDE